MGREEEGHHGQEGTDLDYRHNEPEALQSTAEHQIESNVGHRCNRLKSNHHRNFNHLSLTQ